MPFYNIGKAKQLVSFDGMEWDGVSLSDIDFCLEYRNKIWVIGEVKSQGVIVPTGQRLFLQRFVQMAKDSGRRAIAIICEHHVWNWKETVQLRECEVREYLTTGTQRWAYPRRPYYVGEMIEEYLNLCEGGHCNGQVADGLKRTG